MANVESTQTLLSIIHYAVSRRISKNELKFTYDVNTYLDYTTDSMIIQLETNLAAQPVEHFEVVTYNTWWDHFKLVYAPKWFTDKWPIKSVRHVLDAKMVWTNYVPPRGCEKYGPFLTVATHNQVLW